MLTLLQYLFDQLDFLKIIEALRKHNNREHAARLHLILVQAREILEIYRIVLDELRSALASREPRDGTTRYFLPVYSIARLLDRQSSNLDVMEYMIYDQLDAVCALEPAFEGTFSAIFRGKMGILHDAKMLLSQARLPLSESGPDQFPADEEGIYRTLWFPDQKPVGDRAEIGKFLHGWTGEPKEVVDLTVDDELEFYRALEVYFTKHDPYGKLAEVEAVTTKYNEALLSNFELSDILRNIANVRRHWSPDVIAAQVARPEEHKN